MNPARRYANFARALCTALLLVSATGAVRAQEEGNLIKWSLRAGAFVPTQGTLRSQAGGPYWLVGAEIDPQFRYRFEGGRITFGADAFYRESGGVRFLTIPLTARITWDITPPSSQYRVYGGLGPGGYFVSSEHRGQTLEPGVRFILGADLSKRWYFETNYDYISGFTDAAGNGIHPGGLSLLLGYRF